MRLIRSLILLGISLSFLSACTSSAVKGRRDQRERLVKEGGKMYCEFMNGEAYPDIDIAINLEMAKKCNPEKPMSVTNYKSPTETVGLLYCCVSPENKTAKLDKTHEVMPTTGGSGASPATSPSSPSSGEFDLDEKPSAPAAHATPKTVPSTTVAPR